MIERINLIEKERLQFTHAKLLRIAGAIMLICAFGFLILKFQASRIQKQITRTNDEILNLEESRNALLKATPPKTNTGRFSEIEYAFNESPDWGKLLRDIASRLPPSVWFNSFSGNLGVQQAELNPEIKNHPKGGALETPTTKGVTFSGMSDNLEDIGRFITALGGSPYIEHASLVSTNKENAHFTFVISCGMVRGKN